jgi:16S rRNA (cytidine1402-2'-O)-methyltransferase
MTRPLPSLTLVPTPIGNLDDITLRALKVLREVDLVLAEDTRHAGQLLKHHQISANLKSFHSFNEHKALAPVLEAMKKGQKLALVSDAGTPGISDPGFLLVRALLEEGLTLECLPGATAFVPALVVSGLPCDKFVFEGFLPHKKGRQTRLKALEEESRTIILYESPFRVVKTLEQLISHFGPERKAAASRELTKLFEETVRGTLEELKAHFEAHPPKGEFVMVVAGKEG